MKLLFILNDPPYGTERTYNGLRLARSAVHKGEVEVFLIGDAVAAAKGGQKVPTGYYNVGAMLDGVIRQEAPWVSAARASTRGASSRAS